MKRLIAALALSLAFAGSALAECPPTVDKGKTAGISKDGTHAPLETADSNAQQKPAQKGATQAPLATADSNAQQKPPQKDGSNMPLATQGGTENKDLAVSQQDVEAQQQGEKTAAAQADAEACK